MDIDLYIVTGASRGLGRAVAEQLLQQGRRVLAIARRPSLPDAPRLEQWSADLSDPLPVAQKLEAWLAGVEPGNATLINNAATVVDPALLEAQTAEELSQSLRVGLEAPVLLSAAFLRATQGWRGTRRLLHVSSGLGRRAMSGSAAYCAVKAGLDHLARAQALEQAGQPNGARVVSLAPGVIDTDMQITLRGADPKRFAEQPRFAQLKSQGQLDSPAQAAAKLLAYLARPDFGSNPVGDVRDPA